MEQINFQDLLQNLSPAQYAELQSAMENFPAPKRRGRKPKPEEPKFRKIASNRMEEKVQLSPQLAADGVPLADTGLAPDIRMRYDYYTAVWENHCLKDVLEHYQIAEFYKDILSMPAFNNLYRDNNSVRLAFNGIVFDFPYIDAFLESYDVNEAFHAISDNDTRIYPKITISMSGKGLEWMRDHKIMVEKLLREPPVPGVKNFHVTRCDFAFDFKNFKYDFFVDCFEFLQDKSHLTKAGRLAVIGLPSGLSFKFMRGDTEIIYIGAPTSDRLLRIYDKKLEQSITTSDGSKVFSSNFWGDPRDVLSWVRIEWQLRGSKAMNMLYSTSDHYWPYILKEIQKFYSFRDCSQTSTYDDFIPVADFWANFWDFEIIDAAYNDICGQNGHLV